MPIQFRLDGTVVVDTVSEAIEFESRRGAAPAAPTAKKTSKKRGKTPKVGPGWEGFCGAIAGPAQALSRKILALVQGSGSQGISLTDLARHIGAERNVISGTISGLQKRASAAGLPHDEVLARFPDGLVRPGPLLLSKGAPTP